jgi:2',3'-cyclic-nucleotide 2'-phosphodiesterase (5'-nucleotidase family)
MSYSRRNSPFANSALVVPHSVDKSDIKSGIAFQRQLEQAAFKAAEKKFSLPRQTANDFLANKSGLWDFIPQKRCLALEAALYEFEEKMPGFIENGVLIAQTGQHGGNLGKVTISVENGEITSKIASLIDFEEAQNTAPDKAVADKIAEITANLETLLSEPVGESKSAMSSARNPGVRTQKTPLGSLVADAYREAAGADIAVANGGDIRADLAAGVVTKGDVVSVLPFGNTLMVKTVTPAILRQVLENGVSGIVTDGNGNIDHEQSPQGRFLQVSGFSFAYDPTAPVGERVISVTLDGGKRLALDDDATALTLAGTNYVMTGGDRYSMLAGLSVLRELGAADEALAAYIQRHSPIDVPPAGRIIAEVLEENRAS